MSYKICLEYLNRDQNSTNDGSYILNLKGNHNISKDPAIRTEKDKKHGEFFAIYFYIKATKNVLRVTSKNKNFNTFLTIDQCDSKWNPVKGLLISKTPDKQSFISMMNSISSIQKTKDTIKQNTFLASRLKGFFIKSNRLHEGIESDIDVMGKILKASTALSFILTLFAVGIVFYGKFKQILHYYEQQRAETVAETDINNSLFSGQKENEPAFAFYDKLVRFIKNTAKGAFPATIICGKPGTSKTYMIKRTFHFMKLRPRIDYIIEKGASLDLQDIYSLLYYTRNSILVLDDFDTPLQSADTINLLKSMTDSYKRRIISMPMKRTYSTGQQGVTVLDVPQKFEHKGKVIIVTNMKKHQIDKALLSRCPTLEVDFNSKEIVDALNKMYQFVSPGVDIEIKKEVLNYVLELYKKDPQIDINFRSYQNCVSSRMVDPDEWKTMCQTILNYTA